MARSAPIQTSFAGGELSPHLKGRVETELWKKSLAYCKNWEPLAHGPLVSKAGTRLARYFPDFTPDCRVIPFMRQGDAGFLLVMGNGELGVYDALSGDPVENEGFDCVRNPRFTYGWSYWNTQTVGIVNGRYILGAHDPVPGQIHQTTSSLAAGAYTLSIRYSTAAGNGINVKVGTTGAGSSDLLDGACEGTAGISDFRTKTFTVTVGTPAFVSVWLEIANSNWEFIEGGRPSAQLLEVALRAPGAGYVAWDSGTTPKMPWTDVQLEAIQVVPDPAKNRVVLLHPEVAPHELLFDPETGSWTFGAITFTFDDPLSPPWASPNFPAVGELYQGRLILGGIPNKASTIIGSKSGEPYNFKTKATVDGKTGVFPNCGFSLDISTKGAIRWIQGHRTCLIGTDKGEFILTAQGGVLTPSDFEVRPQSGFGSAAVQSLHLGELALYVSRDRRRLRTLSFNLQENGWQTRDLTFTSEHMTGGLFREVHWISTGNDQVLGVMRSGELVGWTFNRPEQVIAPWRIDVGGEVYSAAVIDSGSDDRVWLLVQRSGCVALEQWSVADDPERVQVDSYISAVGVTGAGVTVFTGLTHLEGEDVWLVNKGVPSGPFTVAGGIIEVPEVDGSDGAYIGLWNPPEMELLPYEGSRGGSSGAKERMVKLTLRLNDSAIPMIDGARAAPDRTPSSPMDEVEPRMTGNVTARTLGWEAKGAVTITQDVPIRTEILAVYGVLSSNEV